VIFEGKKNQFFFGLELTRAGNYMPPVKMLEELSNMYNMTILHNRMMAYVENCIYGGKWDEYKTREK
jgi:hypothetical protein